MNDFKKFYAQNKITPIIVILFPLLIVLAILYFVVTSCLQMFYRIFSYRSSLKVLSIGNITLGGSGKTPFVEWLARRVSCEGHRAAVLMRGYKTTREVNSFVSLNYYVYGDEASMLKESLSEEISVMTGKDRIKKVKTLQNEGGYDTLILDDGFQQWGLKRDLDVVTIDATNPFGNGLLLPAGHLREDIRSLKRADVLCLTRVYEIGLESRQKLEHLLKKVNPGALLVEAVHEPEYLYVLESTRFLSMESRIPLENLKDKDVSLCCGIANPGSFLRLIEGIGAHVALKNFFQDHHVFSLDELMKMKTDCQKRGIRRLIITEKDAPRLSGAPALFKHSSVEILVLKISLKIVKGEEALDERLRTLYHC
jgi:tetraacyldisaccharide 4'-kinase